MNTATTKDSISLTVPRSVILNCLEQEHLLDEIEKKMAEDQEEYDRNIRNLGVHTEHAVEYFEGELSEHVGNPHPLAESLERIAEALESIDDRLARHPKPQRAKKLTVVRKGARTVNRDLEDGPFLPNLETVPTDERCGYTIEKFPHPIDKSLQLYQIHRDGHTLVLNEEDFDALDFEDDESFEKAMDLKFLETNAGRMVDGEAEEGVSVEIEEDEENE